MRGPLLTQMLLTVHYKGPRTIGWDTVGIKAKVRWIYVQEKMCKNVKKNLLILKKKGHDFLEHFNK
jgi:hypothetical protein